jgi:septum formation protein
MRVVLASASPRRQELLKLLMTPFEVIEADYDEDSLPRGRSVREYAIQAADGKANAVGHQVPHGVIIAADTVVFLGKAVFGKPKDEADAVRMLGTLSGKTHAVTTGMCVLRREDGHTVQRILDAPVTEVTFRDLSDAVIRRYIETREPFDKAGAYGVQGFGALLVSSVNGCYYNVVGLPLPRLVEHLAAVGVPIWANDRK